MRRLVFVWAALAPAVASAAEHAEEAGGEHLREFAFEWVNLVLLIGVLVWFGRKPVQAYLATRRDTIAKNLASSEQLLRDAEGKLAEWNAKAARLDGEVAAILASTRKSAEAERAAILADAEAAAARIRQTASAVAARELHTARERLREETAELAVTLAGKLVREHVTADDKSRLVDEVIAKIESGGAR